LGVETLHVRGGHLDLAVPGAALPQIGDVSSGDRHALDVRRTRRDVEDPEPAARRSLERARKVLQPGDVDLTRNVQRDYPEHRDIPLVLRVQDFHDHVTVLDRRDPRRVKPDALSEKCRQPGRGLLCVQRDPHRRTAAGQRDVAK